MDAALVHTWAAGYDLPPSPPKPESVIPPKPPRKRRRRKSK